LGFGGQVAPVLSAFSDALACDPDNAEVAYAFGETLNRLAQPERAQEILKAAFARDMYVPPSWEFARGHSKLLLGDATGAIEHFRSVLDRVDRFVPARVQLIRALWETGQEAEARQEVTTLRGLAPGYSLAHARRMFPYPVEAASDALDAALAGAGLP
jgi:Tfp pilus assembly protein PilF